jgi:heterodisulfide reductase subunit A-like polyferredoxin
MLEILEDITKGEGSEEDIDTLVELAESIKLSSLCGLGQTAPNPVLTTIRYFRDEYEAHIKQKKCPAKVCKALISFSVIQENCKKCAACLKVCPYGAVSVKDKVYSINDKKCQRCGICKDACKFSAIKAS